MVKSILIDESANVNLNKILSDYKAPLPNSPLASSSKTGLIIGTIDNNVDYILNIISTPLYSSTSSFDSTKKNTSPEAIDYDWVMNHALQIHDMLIGGLDILGVYCIDTTPAVAKQLLTKLYKSLNEFSYYKQMKFNAERLVFLVDSTTKNINMKLLDVSAPSDSKSNTFQSCEIKTQKSLLNDQFFRINSNFNLNSKFKTPNVKAYSLTKEDFYKALCTEAMFDNDRFVCLINNCLIDE